ncbi:terminase small subunit [Neisseria bacilliformis]|uniref:terminase small subunit n=1 Tax=Neisseria bacilliformis TaxID=267212 RepID=UPI0028F12E14|nr:terminase small subunit [Neisseria bacilliformis]
MLTDRQARFVDEYLVDLNATQAAVRAGYSAKTASVIGAENLAKPNIQKAIQARQEVLKMKTEITQEWVVERYRRIVEGCDKRLFFKDDGSVKPPSEWSAEMGMAVAAFEVQELGDEGLAVSVSKLRFQDAKAALDSLARHLGMFEEKVKLDVDVSLAERLVRARGRLNDE